MNSSATHVAKRKEEVTHLKAWLSSPWRLLAKKARVIISIPQFNTIKMLPFTGPLLRKILQEILGNPKKQTPQLRKHLGWASARFRRVTKNLWSKNGRAGRTSMIEPHRVSCFTIQGITNA
jgi:hypothetical protein